MKKKKIKKPAPLLYYPLVGLLSFLAKPLFHLRADRTGYQKPKKPCVVMSNHASLFDIIYTAICVNPMRLNIVAGRDVFTWKIFKPFLPFLHAIPKSQFGMDLQAIREMQNALESGCNIYICPEGKTSLDGRFLHYLPPSIGKFIKFTGAPVVTAKIEGSYLAMPRYYHGLKRGRVHVTLKTIITDEEVGTLSANEIYHRIVENLTYNDNLYQEEKGLKFHARKPAKKLDYILYKCPKCGAEYENVVEKDGKHLLCKHCGNRVEYTKYGKFVPDEGSVSKERIDLWYQFERDAVREELLREGFCETEEAELYTVNEKFDYVLRGEGKLTIDREKIVYEGTENGKEIRFVTSILPLHTITTKNKEGIDLMDGDRVMRFMFKDKKHSTKWGLIVEENFRLIKGLPPYGTEEER